MFTASDIAVFFLIAGFCWRLGFGVADTITSSAVGYVNYHIQKRAYARYMAKQKAMGVGHEKEPGEPEQPRFSTGNYH